ncbi:Hypothetical protein FKW44_024546, partial [Caligus rogercresseyi]
EAFSALFIFYFVDLFMGTLSGVPWGLNLPLTFLGRKDTRLKDVHTLASGVQKYSTTKKLGDKFTRDKRRTTKLTDYKRASDVFTCDQKRL